MQKRKTHIFILSLTISELECNILYTSPNLSASLFFRDERIIILPKGSHGKLADRNKKDKYWLKIH